MTMVINFQALFESLPGFHVACDSNFLLISVSSSLIQLTGSSREDLLGRSLSQLFDADCGSGCSSVFQSLRQALNTASVSRSPQSLSVQPFRLRGTSRAERKAEYCWSVTVTPVSSANDEVIYLILFAESSEFQSALPVETASSVSPTMSLARPAQTNQASDSLGVGSDSESPLEGLSEPKLESMQQVETVLSGIQDGFYILNSDWEFTFVNDRLCETVALPRAEILGRRIWDLFPEMVGTALQSQLYQAFAEQIPVHGEYLYPKTLRWHSQRVYPSPDGLTILGTDITDRKRVELMQAEQNRLLEMIASGHSMPQCLAAVCASVSRLSGQARTCLLINDAGRSAVQAIAPDFSESFIQSFKSIRIEDLLTCFQDSVSAERTSTSSVDEDCWPQKWQNLCAVHDILTCYCAPVFNTEGSTVGLLVLCYEAVQILEKWEHQLAAFGAQCASIVYERDVSSFALMESESKYRTLFESIDEGFCICEILLDEANEPVDYRFIEVNPVFEALMGLEEAVGKTMRELVPHPPQIWFEIYERVARTGEPGRFEYHAAATNRWFDVSAFRINDLQKKQFAILCADVTERKEAERERARFLAVGSDLQVIADVEGYFRWVSLTFEKTLGWTADEMTSRPWIDYVHPEDFAKTTSEINRLLDGQKTVSFENRYSHKDGSYRWLLWNAQPYPDEGLIYAVALDVTKRKQAESAVLDRARLSSLSANIGTILIQDKPLPSTLADCVQTLEQHLGIALARIWTLTPDHGLVLQASAGLCSRSDEAHRSIPIGQSEIGLIAQERRAYTTNTVVGDARVQDQEWAIQSEIVGFAGYPLIVENDVIGVLAVFCRSAFSDAVLQTLATVANAISVGIQRKRISIEREQLLVQEKAARETAENANRVKDEFLAVLSHELRSPLNPILGWSQLLQTGELDSETASIAYDTIERNANLQCQLVEDLLDISRIIQGKLTLNAASVDLSGVIANALETVRLAAEAKQIEIQVTVSDRSLAVLGDSSRLQQVVWNLLSNAIKFTDRGGRVQLQLTHTDESVQLQVIDTGKGIAPDFLPHVFEYFRQQDGSTTRKFGGLGLGMAIARQIIELHGGVIWADSLGEGRGATFTLQLPRQIQLAIPELPPSITLQQLSLSGVRILIVDDDLEARNLLQFLLKGRGAAVTATTSALEALQVLEESVPDVLLSDIGMPEMDGFDLIRTIRASERVRDLPVIAITAYAGELNYQQAIEAGFQTHITKPVDSVKLVTAIMELTAGANLHSSD